MSDELARPGSPSNSSAIAGITMADVLELPQEMRHLTTWMMRQREVTLAEAMRYMGQSETELRPALRFLVDKGFATEVEVDGQAHYRIRMLLKQNRQVSIDLWATLQK